MKGVTLTQTTSDGSDLADKIVYEAINSDSRQWLLYRVEVRGGQWP